jgi:2-(1,2-epoxy-1,2-dihydrophenyl)acetyl-CoA isomerase
MSGFPLEPRIEDGVLRLTVSRADEGCALWHDAVPELTATLRAAAGSAEVGAVLLVGEGANFCTGGNVKTFASAADPGESVGRLAREFHAFVLALVRGPLPVVAAAKGWAAGAGLSLVCAADLAVAGPGTRLRAAYPSIGYSPDGGLSWTLPRIVGTARARDLILTDRVLSGEAAHRDGLVARLVDNDEVALAAEELARTLAKGPAGSYGRIKALLAESPDGDLAGHLDLEERAVAACADSQAGREGVAAFVHRRPADFAAHRG